MLVPSSESNSMSEFLATASLLPGFLELKPLDVARLFNINVVLALALQLYESDNTATEKSL